MSFAQNTVNTLPDSGNVGIGVMNPTCKFEVKGQTHLMNNVKIDSSVAISDSAKVGRNIKIGGDAFIEKSLTVNGKSNFNQPIYLNYLNNLDTIILDTSIYNVESILGVSTTTSAVETKIKIILPKPPIEYNYCRFKILPFSLSKLINTVANDSDVSLCPEYRNLGIGTTVPQAKVDISVLNETGLIVGSYQNKGYGILSKVSSNNTKALAVFNSISPNDDRFVVYGDGEVYGREFIATNNTFVHPDYVFKQNYKLMPLNVLDKYVKKNHHLPDIPSAKQVKQQGGIHLGQMQEKLLKKVEELTLYTIQQQKEIDELKAEMKKN